jgi:ABC-2 type transport system permease protein
LPQVFLGGILWEVELMPKYLQYISDVLPLTYAVKGLRDIMYNGKDLLDVGGDLGVLIGFTILTSILAALTLKRGTN